MKIAAVALLLAAWVAGSAAGADGRADSKVPSAAAAASRPDLVVRAVTPPRDGALAGGAFDVRLIVRNRGLVTAPRSVVRLLASTDDRAGRGDPRLGKARIRALRPGQRRRITLRVNVAQASRIHLVACADARRRIREARERNNCRASAPLTVRSTDVIVPTADPAPTPDPAPNPVATDADGDGTLDAADCAPSDPKIHPGAADAPDDSFADSNCDGVDGSAASSVFVAPNGSDGAAGTRQAPLATIGAGIQKAKSLGRSAVLVRAGTYNGTVALADGIGLFGGYGADWKRSAAATTTIKSTTVVDSDRVVALEALNIKTATRVERFRIETGDLTTSGDDSIAVRVVGSPGLRLEDSLLIAGDGGPGAAGMTGTDGVDATEPGKFGYGGTCDFNAAVPGGAGAVSPVGRHGGKGGGGAEGVDGTPGLPGVGGALGGAPGAADDPGLPGQDGQDGANGITGALGALGSGGFVSGGVWYTDVGGNGANGAHGGGGQGGFAGQGGGASFGILAVSSTGMTLTGNTFQAGHGGAAGAGGYGGFGGVGSPGGLGGSWCSEESGPGGDGGDGGDGGKGGRGGGGAGGPSYGIFRSGTTLATAGNAITFSSPGAGGAPNGLAGASGAVN